MVKLSHKYMLVHSYVAWGQTFHFLLMFLCFLSSVISPTEFKIGNTSGVEFLPYKHGGMARQMKVSKIATFVSNNVLD